MLFNQMLQSHKANAKRRHVTHPYNGLPLFLETALTRKVLAENRIKASWFEIYCPKSFLSCSTAVAIVSRLASATARLAQSLSANVVVVVAMGIISASVVGETT